jgi:hypothetical protein
VEGDSLRLFNRRIANTVGFNPISGQSYYEVIAIFPTGGLRLDYAKQTNGLHKAAGYRWKPLIISRTLQTKHAFITGSPGSDVVDGSRRRRLHAEIPYPD